jgi:hypothetical protein
MRLQIETYSFEPGASLAVDRPFQQSSSFVRTGLVKRPKQNSRRARGFVYRILH